MANANKYMSLSPIHYEDMLNRASNKRWLTNNNSNSSNGNGNNNSSISNSSSSTGGVSKEIRYRIVILGAAGVGKSTIISQYLYGCSAEEMLRLSVGVVPVLPVTHTGKSSLIMHMHEVAYQAEDRRLILELLELDIDVLQDDNWWVDVPSADGYIIVYSVTDDSALESVSCVRDELIKQHSFLHVPIVVVANKMDADDGSKREQHVLTELTVGLEWEHGYVATSAATDPDSLWIIFWQMFRQLEVSPDHQIQMRAWLDLHRDPSRQKGRDTPFNKLSRRIKKLMCVPQ